MTAKSNKEEPKDKQDELSALTGIIEKGNCYYRLGKENQKKKITNFLLKIKFEIQGDDGFKTYLAIIQLGKTELGPFLLKSSDWKSEINFREWLGKISGMIDYSGSKWDLPKLINHCFRRESPVPIKIVDGYGNVDLGLWVFDNGAIHGGKVVFSNEQGISWVTGYSVSGIRTSTWGNQKQLVIPQGYFTLEQIIENLVRFWKEPGMIWPMIGYAAATIFFKEVARKLKCFPGFLCYGPKDSGKTRFAHCITSLCGAGSLEVPSSDSTTKGLRRYISRNHSMPIVINEAVGTELERLICSFYDLDPYFMGERTTDSRTKSIGFNSSGIFTAIRSPEREDVLSRLILIDFHNFAKDQRQTAEFTQFYFDGVVEGKNFGFLLGLVQADVADQIVPLIFKMTKAFTQRIPDLSSRQQLILGTLAGAFMLACDALNLWDIFEKLGARIPDEEGIVEVFKHLGGIQTKLMKEQTEMRVFFETLEGLWNRNKLEYYMKIGHDGEEYMELHLSSVLPSVLEDDRRTGKNLLKGVSRSWISNQLKLTFNSKSETGSIHSKILRLHKIYIKDIINVYGLEFDTGEEPDELHLPT